ncbi:MAG: hypothetical protein ABI534_07950 [Chloroflexota bacterium]
MLSRAQALLGALPAGVDWVIATALGRRPPRGRLERASSPAVPVVIGILLLLAIVPLVFAGLELIIHRSSAKELVDRVTGPSITLVELSGVAQLPPVPGPPREDGTPMRYYFVRDSAARRDVVVVRSDVTPQELTTRDVTGVIVEDPDRLAFDATALAARGASVDAGSLGGRYLREDPGAGDATEITVSEIGAHEPGTIVRVRLRFGSVAVPGCGSSADEPCEIAALAGGRAHFDHLAFDAGSGAPLVVRNAYPAALVPMRVFGTQVTDRDPLDALFAAPPGSILGAWGRELRTAWIDRDPDLPLDRPWVAPLLLLAFALVLLAGRRVGYPIFRLTDADAVPDAVAAVDPAAGIPTGALDVVASGRLSQAGGGPIDVDRVPGRLSAAPGRTTVELQLDGPDGPIRSVITRALREVSAIERGDLVHVHGRKPSLALHWFGNDVMLAFETDADRDRAAALLSGDPR